MRLSVLILLFVATTPHLFAQIKSVGCQASIGAAYADDDLFFNSPVFAWGCDFFCDYRFRARSSAADNFFLRFGVGVVKQGSCFEMEFPYADSQRKGRYDIVSLRLPLRFGWGLDIGNPDKKMKLSFFTGPSVSAAVAGSLHDEQQSGRYDSDLVNFDRDLHGSEAFKTIRRFDFSVGFGVMLAINRLTAILLWDVGFVPQRDRSDALPFVDVEPSEAPSGYYALNRTLLFGIGYSVPVKHRPRHRSPQGVIFM